MTRLKLGDAVRITWEDAWSEADHNYSVEDILDEKPFIVESVGILIRNIKEGVSIARDLRHLDNKHKFVFHVPRAMIHSIRRLK